MNELELWETHKQETERKISELQDWLVICNRSLDIIKNRQGETK